MTMLKLRIDIGGTLGDDAWLRLRHFPEIEGAAYGERFGSSGKCKHDERSPHFEDEWCGAQIALPTFLLAQYALSYYLEQDRVLDAEIDHTSTVGEPAPIAP